MQMEPDLILPAQFLRATVSTPEKRLLLAVLEEAVGTYQRYVVEADRHSVAVFADVEAWFASDDSVWLYSFVAICDVVGLDPTYVRAGLGLWTDMQRTQPAETAPLSYRFPFRRMNGTRHRTNARATGMARDPRGLIQTRQGT
jgi:hypothetical protein